METLATRYGEGTSLEDFERKAQMMNYETYRAMFEGLQAHLWTKNSGRLLWMTHPAWPSNHWQIYSADYDTHAAYYGVKKAVEPRARADEPAGLHRHAWSTRTRDGAHRTQARSRACSSLDGARARSTARHRWTPAPTTSRRSATSTSPSASRRKAWCSSALRLRDPHGTLISDNTTGRARTTRATSVLNALARSKL